jgi:hypothetical protein
MAVLFFGNFSAGLVAYYTSQGWAMSTSSLTSTALAQHKTPNGIGSTYAINLNNTGVVTSPSISGTPRFFHYYIKPQNPGTWNDESILFRAAGGVTASMSLRATGFIQVSRGTSTTHTSNTLLATSATTINRAVGHWVAVELDAQDAGGTFTVWVDDVQMVTFAGDTKGSATTAGWSQFDPKQGPTDDNCYITDIIVTDNTTGRLSEQYAQTLSPDSVDSGNLVGSPVTGASRYQNIDEIPTSQTDYNYAQAVNDEDLYGFGNVPTAFASISTVEIEAQAIAAGVITQGEISYKGTGATSYGTANPIGASYEVWARILDTDPDTAAAWTGTAINAALFGVRFS